MRSYQPLLDRSVQLVHASGAWAQLGGPSKAGRGLKIANLDTGIDIKNPCFRDAGIPRLGNGFPRADTSANLALTNRKVIVARAFGDPGKRYSAADASGHGTFTAAIEACDYDTPIPAGTRVSGVAPGAYLMNYNIAPGGLGQTASDDAIVAALQQAVLDGADVINLSFGNPLGPGDARLDPEATAIDLTIKGGVPVVVAAGNAGPTVQTAATWGAGKDAIEVGSTSNARSMSSSITVDSPPNVPPELLHIRADEGTHSWSATVGPARLADVGLGRLPHDDPANPRANDFAGKTLRGKIAFIERGNGRSHALLYFKTKVKNAERAGAVGVIIYDDRDELILGSPDQGASKLPVMFISRTDGLRLRTWMQAHPNATVTMNSAISAFEEVPNVLSNFSSRGYGANYSIEPNLVAPGQDIYSATESSVPNSLMYSPSGFISESGTSFSAPHVTGAVALLLQKHPTWTPGLVKADLMETASTEVTLGASKSAPPSVMDVGAGLLNIEAALSSTANLTPPAHTFGEMNTAIGMGVRHVTLVLQNLSSDGSSWSATVQQLHGAGGFSVDLPSPVTLPPGGRAELPIRASATAQTAPGNYDGYITLTHGNESLHVPYFAHVVSQAVATGSVLLVDDSTSRFRPAAPAFQVASMNVARWYESALTRSGKAFTYWNEAALGTPSLPDMKRASAVVLFTGNNLNGYTAQNSNGEALDGPLSAADVSAIHSYLDAGGKVFVSGMAAALSDPYWSAIVMGGAPSADFVSGASSDLSLYDNQKNDKSHIGHISPPRPSAVPDTSSQSHINKWIFGNLKPIDFSSQGDGANDNLASYSPAVEQVLGDGLVGVPGLVPVRGGGGFQGQAYGQAALRTTRPALAQAAVDVAVVSSDEPSLGHIAKFRGRSVLFSFGFEGINDNTGFATREQVLSRILRWFDDRPLASIIQVPYRSRQNVQLQARLRSSAQPAEYTWQIGASTIRSAGKPARYWFGRPGSYPVRVQITDTLGHVAVSPWTRLRVR
jgi:subtilisin family serine protease